MSPALARKAPNKLGEDITVPRSAIPEAVRRLKDVSAKYGLPIVIFGHAGDGNLHPNILFDKRDPEQWAKVEQMVAEEFAIALELGGTLSGEHGVGTLKRPYMRARPGASLDRISKTHQAWPSIRSTFSIREKSCRIECFAAIISNFVCSKRSNQDE